MTFLPLLSSSALALLQAGGGGSFGGGGGGGGGFSGGGGGDGDGIGWLIYLLIRLAIEVPVIGVPLLIGVVALVVVGGRKGWWRHQERVIQRARPARERRAAAVSARTLEASDPDFDPGRFLARVSEAFRKAQAAWCAQELEPLRPFVSDGVFERFSLQVEEQREDGWRQGMEGLSVSAPQLAHVEPGRHFDAVTVRIGFRADIHRLELASGRRIPGSQLPRNHFVECWTFLRRRGARTRAGDGLMEGRCPNCGAPLTINQSAKCGHCGCLARSGEFDWVLTEITQESEWRPEREAALPGFEALSARDPGLNVALLEDRASVAFWREAAAARAGDVDPLRRVADEALCAELARRYASEDGKRGYEADRAVGSVRTLGFLPGERVDRALVELVWDGRLARVDAKGRRRLDPQRRLWRTLYVFAREAGATTRLAESFTTAHCQECGAHDLGGTSSSCAYCGAPRTGGRASWLLTALLPVGLPEARALLGELSAPAPTPRRTPPPVPQAAAPRSPADLVTWSAALAQADGIVSDREERALHALAERLGVGPERAQALLERPLDGAAPAPSDPAEARAWLDALAELALADGHMNTAERRLLYRAGERAGLGAGEAEHALREARTRLYRASREAQRAV